MKQYILITLLLISTPSALYSNFFTFRIFGPSQEQKELMAAILTQKVAKIRLFLKKGVDPNFIDPVTQNTPLGAICASVTMNIETKTELIQSLYNHKVNINMLNSFGRTPLIQAIKTGDCDLIETLLKIGADPQCGSIEVKGHTLTPLAYAHYLDRKDIIRILKNYDTTNLTSQQRDNLTMALSARP